MAQSKFASSVAFSSLLLKDLLGFENFAGQTQWPIADLYFVFQTSFSLICGVGDVHREKGEKKQLHFRDAVLGMQ